MGRDPLVRLPTTERTCPGVTMEMDKMGWKSSLTNVCECEYFSGMEFRSRRVSRATVGQGLINADMPQINLSWHGSPGDGTYTQKCAFSWDSLQRVCFCSPLLLLGCYFSFRDNIFRKFSVFRKRGWRFWSGVLGEHRKGESEKLTKGQFILFTLIKSYVPSL